jgi:para-nitrobenzyl esterase
MFGSLGLGNRVFGQSDFALSARWQEVLFSFARSGRPAPNWPAVAANSTQVMAFGQTQGPNPALAPAVSTPERLSAWREYAAGGGRLGLM